MVGGLLPEATKDNKGLLESNTFFNININPSGNSYKPGYLILPSISYGSNYAIHFKRASHNGLLLISSNTNIEATEVSQCDILVIGKCDMLIKARFIKTTEKLFLIELALNIDVYVNKLSVLSFDVGGTATGDILLSEKPISNVSGEVAATIKRFSAI